MDAICTILEQARNSAAELDELREDAAELFMAPAHSAYTQYLEQHGKVVSHSNAMTRVKEWSEVQNDLTLIRVSEFREMLVTIHQSNVRTMARQSEALIQSMVPLYHHPEQGKFFQYCTLALEKAARRPEDPIPANITAHVNNIGDQIIQHIHDQANLARTNLAAQYSRIESTIATVQRVIATTPYSPEIFAADSDWKHAKLAAFHYCTELVKDRREGLISAGLAKQLIEGMSIGVAPAYQEMLEVTESIVGRLLQF